MRMTQEMSRNNQHLLDKVEQNIVISQCLAGQLFAKAHFLTASVTDVQCLQCTWQKLEEPGLVGCSLDLRTFTIAQ